MSLTRKVGDRIKVQSERSGSVVSPKAGISSILFFSVFVTSHRIEAQ